MTLNICFQSSSRELSSCGLAGRKISKTEAERGIKIRIRIMIIDDSLGLSKAPDVDVTSQLSRVQFSSVQSSSVVVSGARRF